MADLNSVSDQELRTMASQFGIADVPITKSTRDVVIKRLKSRMSTAGNCSSSYDHKESTVESRLSSTRRRSVDLPPKPKTRQRASLAVTPHPQSDSKTDKSDEHETGDYTRRTPAKLSTSRVEKKQVKSESEPVSSNTFHEMSDEELCKQLSQHKIVAPAIITRSKRPILIKELNHAIEKQKQESKSCDDKQDHYSAQEPDKDSQDNLSLVHPKEKLSQTPIMSSNQQHSLSFGSTSQFLLNDSFIKPRLSDFKEACTPPSKLVITKSSKRLLEEQNSYEVESDSENGNLLHEPVKNPAFFSAVIGKLNIPWQRQFSAVVFPLLLAILFFVSAVYITVSYNQVDSTMDQTIQNIKMLLEKESVSRLCHDGKNVSVDLSFIMEHFKMDETGIKKISESIRNNPQWGIVVDDEYWSVPGARLPIWCSIKKYLWNFSVTPLIITIGFGTVVLLAHRLITANCRQREKEKQELNHMVEMIIDLLCRHHAAMMTERRPNDGFLAVTHVRDNLIPLKEREAKLKLWNKAVQFLEDNESRVRREIQQIKGEDFRVWRWLPSTTALSVGKPMASTDQIDDSLTNNSNNCMPSSATVRPKVGQGQAFSIDSTGVNLPPPYPLTQCLKVRNMFDTEVEAGDSWPVRIQNVILQKADKCKIMHIAVDRDSREGYVYIKCATPDDAGKLYHSLHGWWFGENLVTVEYLSPERYQYRFPDSAKTTTILQPSKKRSTDQKAIEVLAEPGYKSYVLPSRFRERDDLTSFASTSSSGRQTLEEIFGPPIDLMFNGSLHNALHIGKVMKKWVMVNIQNVSEFNCQVLNRDVWSQKAIKKLVRENFIFLQLCMDSEQGQLYMAFYKINEWPYVSVLDPRTREVMVAWNYSDAKIYEALISEFLVTSAWVDEEGTSALPSEPKKRRLETISILDASEDDQLQAAVRASLVDNGKSSDDESGSEEDETVDCFDSESDSRASEPKNSREAEWLDPEPQTEEVAEETKVSDDDWMRHLGPETDPTSSIVFRFPDGSKENKALPCTSTLMAVVKYVASKGFPRDKFEVMAHFPKRLLLSMDSEMTLKDAGLFPSDSVFVQAR